jgi:hypothetical protein
MSVAVAHAVTIVFQKNVRLYEELTVVRKAGLNVKPIRPLSPP